MMLRLSLGLLVLAASPLASAVEIDAIEGAYHHHFENGDVSGDKFAGEDVLEIVKITNDSAYFRTHLDFFNGHVCSLWGVADLVGDQLVYRPKSQPNCVLTLAFSDKGVTFSDPAGACREQNCGARGSFDGTSFPAKSRRAISYLSKLLASRQYQEALAEHAADR